MDGKNEVATSRIESADDGEAAAMPGALTVRARLRLLVLACVLPALVAAALAVVAAYREGRAARLELALASARSMSRSIDAELGNAVAGLRVLATSPSLVRGDLAAFYDQARSALAHQGASTVMLGDIHGRQLLNTFAPYGAPLPPRGSPAVLQAVLDSGAPAASDLFVGTVTRQPMVSVAVPVQQGGRVAYVLAAGFLPRRFAEVLARQQPDPDWVVNVIDRSGTLVARTHGAERFVGRQAVPTLLSAIRAGPEGMVKAELLEGIEVLAPFHRSRTTGWTVSVAIPRASLLAPLERAIAWLGLGTVVLLSLGLFLARRAARPIADSMRALVPPALALGRGEPVVVPPLPLQEAAQVASALRQAERLLRRRTAERDRFAHGENLLRMRNEQLAHAASHDALTGLGNRSLFEVALARRLRDAGGRPFTLLYVDLDDFKPVNDAYGHAAGDDLLRAVAARLAGSFRDDDVVARLGGDEFAVLVDGLPPAQALASARALVQRLSEPYAIGAWRIEVSACIGVAGYPDHGTSAEDLLAASDAAMYHAKATGKRDCVVSGFAALT
ncbi:MAG TPA: sensor domain-containing diguanylate cyclase [Ideonella sp.]|nr:sensor domain-containing diguanylate cyclase [Ideonella sp.]